MTPDCDVLVIGGGLTGSSLALQVQKAGFSTLLFHSNQKQGHCASTVPLGLFNPAAAMQAKKSAFAEQALYHLDLLLQEVQPYSDKTIGIKNGVIRPALDETLLSNFKRSFEQEAWPDNWIDWLDADQMKTRFPKLTPVKGGLFVKTGQTIDTPAFLHAIHHVIKKSKPDSIINEQIHSVSKNGSFWKATSEKGTTYCARKIVFACSAGIERFPEWGFLKFHSVKGETLTFSLPEKVFECAVAGKGYLAFKDHKLVVGSTYDHHFKDINPTAKARSILMDKLLKMVPDGFGLEEKSATSWAGIRLSSPDRMPVIGEHPLEKGLYISTGFGSKGIMYSGLCASFLTEHLLNGKSIPETFICTRFK